MTEQETSLGSGPDPAGGVKDMMPRREDQWVDASGSGTEKRPRFQIPGGGSLVLVGLFLAGIAGLYVLSLSSGPASASASDDEKLAEARVDSVLLEFEKPAGSTRTPAGLKMVERFYHDSRSRQIPLRDLQTNPFIFKPPLNVRKIIVQPKKKTEPKKPTVSVEWQEAAAAAERMQLQSILSGKYRKVAMISNNLLTEGQQIDGWIVVEIRRRSVALKWKDRTFVLRMPE